MESKIKLVRLNQKSDFLSLSRSGKKIRASDWLLLLSKPNGSELTRIGFSVGSQLAPAVTRNKLKRWSRTLVLRGLMANLKIEKGLDLHLIFRAPRNEKAPAFYKKLKFVEFTQIMENAIEKLK